MNAVWQRRKGRRRSWNRGQKILIGFLGLLMLVFGLVVVMRVWAMPPLPLRWSLTKIPKGEYDPAAWGKAYP